MPSDRHKSEKLDLGGTIVLNDEESEDAAHSLTEATPTRSARQKAPTGNQPRAAAPAAKPLQARVAKPVQAPPAKPDFSRTVNLPSAFGSAPADFASTMDVAGGPGVMASPFELAEPGTREATAPPPPGAPWSPAKTAAVREPTEKFGRTQELDNLAEQLGAAADRNEARAEAQAELAQEAVEQQADAKAQRAAQEAAEKSRREAEARRREASEAFRRQQEEARAAEQRRRREREAEKARAAAELRTNMYGAFKK